MRILFCSNTFEHVHHGPAKFANLLLEINTLHPGHQVRILTEDVSACRLDGLPHVYKARLRIPLPLKPLGQVLRMFQYYRQARRIGREYPYDVLVFNNAFIGLWAAIASGKPTVGMVNDEKNILASLRNFRPDRWWLKQFIFGYFEKRSVHRHRLVIANSDFLTRRLIGAYGLPAEKVKRLYKAIDLGKVQFVPQRAFGSPIRVLFVKADYRVGRLDLLVDALARLSQYRFALTIIGPEPQFEPAVAALCRRAANVSAAYRGPQSQAVVYDCFYRHDLFCVPSATEALGVANIEALAAGIPVVSTRVGGIPEVLDHGRNGWLVEPGDASGLAGAIQQCIDAPELRREKTANGRAFVQKFSKENMLRGFLEIMEELSR